MPFNLQIVGVGGQGVVTLAQLFRNLCMDNGIQCTGSILKGGAQRLGTVQATLRIFEKQVADYRNYSLEIPARKLDLMIAMEPWEGLRFYRLCSPATKLLVNAEIVPLMIERSFPVNIDDPVATMSRLGLDVCARNFSASAIQEHGSKRMLNYAMGLFAVRHYLEFFSEAQFSERFRAITGNAA